MWTRETMAKAMCTSRPEHAELVARARAEERERRLRERVAQRHNAQMYYTVGIQRILEEIQGMRADIDNRANEDVIYQQYLENDIDTVQNAPEGGISPMVYKREWVNLGLDDNGNPIRKQISGKTQDERNAEIIKAYIQSGKIRDFLTLDVMAQWGLRLNNEVQPTKGPEKPKKDFCEYAENWFQRCKQGVIKGNSSYQIHYRLEFAKKYFQGRFLEDITTGDIQDYMNAHAKYSHKTLTDFKGVLHDLFQYAEDEGDIEVGKIKWNRIKNPGNHEKHRKAQSDQHYSDIVAHIPDLDNYPMEQLIVAVFAYLGLRPEEVRGLRWEDIDFEAKKVHIERVVVYHGGVKAIPHEKSSAKKQKQK